MSKLLITPVVTPLGLPSEEELKQVGPEGVVMRHTGEGQQIPEQLRDGAPEHFHTACRRLLESLRGKTDAILVGGTTGEGAGFGINQYEALLKAMKKACPTDIRIFAGILGENDRVKDQIRAAFDTEISTFVLGMNHTKDSQRRFQLAKSILGHLDKLWLYNMPTFAPASLAFIRACMQDQRVVGIKDSSAGTNVTRLRQFLELKEERPDFQVLAGSEGFYGYLDEQTFARIDGLVSGNSNAAPDLLRNFTDDPASHAHARQKLYQHIVSFRSHGYRDTPTEMIEKHILGLKIRLWELGIFKPENIGMYGTQGTLFHTYQGN